MKNNFYKYLFLVLFCFLFENSYGKEFYINASQVDGDKEKKIVYAQGSVEIKDHLGNVIFSEQAEYDKLNGIVKTIGETTVVTSEKYVIEGQDIVYDDQKKLIYSEYDTKIKDLAGNQTTTEIYGTIITVDQTPPADGSLTPNNTDDDMITGSVVTNAPFPDINVVSGFWNSHNTGLKLTAPLPAGDPSLIGGAVLILGKKSGNDTYDQLGYSITTVDGVTGAHSSNDLYDVSFNITDSEYNYGDPKTVPLPYDPNFPQDGWLEDGDYLFVEDITDYADGENLSFAARVFDNAGNYTDWAESTTRLKVDLTAPTITEVTSLNDNLAYNERDGIDNNNDGVIDEDGEADEDQLIYISVVASEYMRNVDTGLDNSSLELNAGGSSNLAVFRGIGQQLVPSSVPHIVPGQIIGTLQLVHGNLGSAMTHLEVPLL